MPEGAEKRYLTQTARDLLEPETGEEMFRIEPDIRQLCQALIEAEEVIKFYQGLSDDPARMGHEIFEGKYPIKARAWLSKYSEGE